MWVVSKRTMHDCYDAEKKFQNFHEAMEYMKTKPGMWNMIFELRTIYKGDHILTYVTGV